MLKSEKTSEIQMLSDRLGAAKAAIVAEYRGLSVEEMTELRMKVREAESSIRVIKNRLAKIAAANAGLENLDGLLSGPNALATADADPVPLAKALVEYAKDHEIFQIKGGVVEGKAVGVAELKALADLPSREVLLAQLLGAMNGTARNLVSVLAAVPRGLVTAIKAIGEQKDA